MTGEGGVKIWQGTLVMDQVSFAVVQRVTEKEGAIQIELEVSADGQIPSTSGREPEGIIYSMQIPAPAFAGGIYEAGGMVGPLSTEKLPLYEIKLFQGNVGNVSFSYSGGLNLRAELEPATAVIIQDRRQWSPISRCPSRASG